MKRPLLILTISLAIGILAAQVSHSYLFIALCAPVFLLAATILSFKFRAWTLLFAGIVLFFSIGAFEYLYVDGVNTGKFNAFLGKQVTVRAYIDSEPDVREASVVYTVRTKEITCEGKTKRVDGKILFTTMKDKKGYFYDYGREIEIRGQLNIPKGRTNPGGFDYRSFLAKSGVSATLFAAGDNVKPGSGRYGSLPVQMGLVLRNRIIVVINKSLPQEQAGLLNGMLIGYKEGLAEEAQSAFSDAGLSHIMAVSGANVAFLVFPLVFLFKKLRFRRTVANVAIMGILVLFVFVTGFSPSVLRAVIMAVIMLTGQMLKRETDVYTSIAFAAMLLLLYSPYTLFDIGFQLSFAATLSLVMFYKSIKERVQFKYIPGFVGDVLAATLAVQVFVVPLSAFYFNKISLISIVSNVLVVPVVEGITLLGSLMAVLGQISVLFSQIIGYVNYTLLTFVLLITKVSASQPFAVLQVVTPPVLVLFLYYGAVLFLRWYSSWEGRSIRPLYYAIAAGIMLAGLYIGVLLPRGLEVVFIDVGEGDSALVRTSAGKTVLIDGGGAGTSTNVGESVVIPFLLDYGVSRLDLVVATHAHEDHMAGLIPIVKDFGVGGLVIPDDSDKEAEFAELLEISKSRNLPVNACQKGDVIKLDDKTFFKVLHPAQGLNIDKEALNESCLVLKLCYKDVRVLFTGDIGMEIENALLESKADLKADILKVAHHGSAGSTSSSFLAAVRPEAAVISVGKNKFGHPSPGALERLAAAGVRLFRTDRDGAVIFSSDGKTMRIQKTVMEN